MMVVRQFYESKAIILFLLLVLSIALSAVISLFHSVEIESLREQKSLTPAFNLLSREIIRPMYIAETIAMASPLKVRMNENPINEKKILAKLESIAREFDMEFFVASETSRVQYNSDGSMHDLIEGKVEWYFRSKQIQQDIIGVLGNRNSVNVYYDIKIFAEDGRFLGFVGVNRKLESFVNSFENFKNQFGYDFVIADANDDILLSSDKTLLADGKRIENLQSLGWYKAMLSEGNGIQNNNMVVGVDGDDFLIARITVEELNWRLFLVNPLKTRQNESANAFFIQTIKILCLLIVLAFVLKFSTGFILKELAKKYQNDPLTNILNRASLKWHFQKFIKNGEVALVMVDLDHFKDINDEYGHRAGDKVLIETVNLLKTLLRKNDVIGRWGGEEFLLVLPNLNTTAAFEIAERARSTISENLFDINEKVVSITASFGVISSASIKDLDDLVAKADEYLYTAKREGRNTVRSAL